MDTLNPTGYAQVVYEFFTGGTPGNREQNHNYVYGAELIIQVRNYQASFNNITQRIYCVAASPERSRGNGRGSERVDRSHRRGDGHLRRSPPRPGWVGLSGTQVLITPHFHIFAVDFKVAVGSSRSR